MIEVEPNQKKEKRSRKQIPPKVRRTLEDLKLERVMIALATHDRKSALDSSLPKCRCSNKRKPLFPKR